MSADEAKWTRCGHRFWSVHGIMPLNGAPRRDAHGVTLRCAAVAQVSDIDVRCYGQLGKICSHEFFAFCPKLVPHFAIK
jgi:hypothetical protein